MPVPHACNSGGTNEIKTCTLEAGPNSKDFPLTIEYSATLTGDAEITDLTCQTNSGKQTTSDLTSSGSKIIDLESGASVESVATVEVNDDSAEVAYVGKDGDGNVSIEESDQFDTNSD